jgi:chromosome segregation ATPase
MQSAAIIDIDKCSKQEWLTQITYINKATDSLSKLYIHNSKEITSLIGELVSVSHRMTHYTREISKPHTTICKSCSKKQQIGNHTYTPKQIIDILAKNNKLQGEAQSEIDILTKEINECLLKRGKIKSEIGEMKARRAEIASQISEATLRSIYKVHMQKKLASSLTSNLIIMFVKLIKCKQYDDSESAVRE